MWFPFFNGRNRVIDFRGWKVEVTDDKGKVETIFLLSGDRLEVHPPGPSLKNDEVLVAQIAELKYLLENSNKDYARMRRDIFQEITGIIQREE